MITLRRISTRPSLDVEFFAENEAYKSTLEEFKSSGKILNEQESFSEDQLTRTREITFLDDENFLFWRHHPNIVAWIKQRKKYEYENSIDTDVDFV